MMQLGSGKQDSICLILVVETIAAANAAFELPRNPHLIATMGEREGRGREEGGRRTEEEKHFFMEGRAQDCYILHLLYIDTRLESRLPLIKATSNRADERGNMDS